MEHLSEERLRNFNYSKDRFKSLECSLDRKKGNIAIVGGSPSLKNKLEELKKFKGDILSINGAHRYLYENGIKSIYFTAHIYPEIKYEEEREKIKRFLEFVEYAIVPNTLDIISSDLLKNKNVIKYSLEERFGKPVIIGGSSSVGFGISIAAHLGYNKVYLYGCDGSYTDRTHTYQQELNLKNIQDCLLMVRANNKEYLTNIQMLDQCIFLKEMFEMLPEYIVNKTEGLLNSMLKDDEWEISAFNDKLAHHLKENNIVKDIKFIKEIKV